VDGGVTRPLIINKRERGRREGREREGGERREREREKERGI